MNNDLEKLVQTNIDRFDRIESIEEDRLWAGIQNQLDNGSHQAKFRIWFGIAASIILLLSLVLIYQSIRINNKVSIDNNQLLASTFPELAQQFKIQNNQIFAQKASISFDTINPQDYPDVFEEMNILNANYQLAFVDLQKLGKEEAILRVLLRYHQRQLDLLERLSNEIEKKKLYDERNQHAIY
jgi:hypothetical protein